jgi:hypothetical protein
MQQSYLRSANAIHPVPLSTFLLLTFGSAWLIWLPLLVAQYMSLTLPVPSVVLITLGSFAPTATALLLTWRYAGKTELHQLLGRALIWRVSPVWYVITIAGPALIMLLAMGIHVLLGDTAPDLCPIRRSLVNFSGQLRSRTANRRSTRRGIWLARIFSPST